MNFNSEQFPTYKPLFPVLRTKTTSDSDDEEAKKVEKAWEMLRNITIKQKR